MRRALLLMLSATFAVCTVQCVGLGGLAIPAEPFEDGGDTTVDARDSLADGVDTSRRFCDAVDAHFCADFDLAAVNAGWTASTVSDAGTVTLTEAGVSPPHALQSSLRGAGVAVLRKALPTSSRFVVALDARHGCVGHPAASWSLIELRCTGTMGTGGVVARIDGIGSPLIEVVFAGPVVRTESRTFPFPNDNWRHVVLDVTPGNPGAVTLVVDDVPIVAGEALSNGCVLGAWDLLVGLDGSDPCEMTADNIVVRVEP